MTTVLPTQPPPSSLLMGLRENGSYTDCYTTVIPISITQAEYVEAFYTTALFKAERLIIRLLVAKPTTDREARDLAQGTRDSFAVWRVTGRRPEQLLLTDASGVTSSWLMSEAIEEGNSGAATRLLFGSAITGRLNEKTGKREFSFIFHALLGFHNLYSRRLLSAAASRLLKQKAQKELRDEKTSV